MAVRLPTNHLPNSAKMGTNEQCALGTTFFSIHGLGLSNAKNVEDSKCSMSMIEANCGLIVRGVYHRELPLGR